ncbi:MULTISPECIES: porin family protein [unclassified Vibrio]|uniref:porin family protein n=1 Tax=unclassified Vibrio TaxID=2614977 RepID=UPI001E433015|nr:MULTISPECIES: porin family protein [unclassified Vibrio]
MNKFTTLVASTVLLSFSVLADDAAVIKQEANGHRIGVGFATTKDVTHDDLSLGNGLKLEYGYEFNNIIGVNFSYSGFSDSYSEQGITLKVEGSTFKLDTDIGYTFHFDRFSIKPYGAIGVVKLNEEWNLYGEKDDFDDTTLFLGVGARATLDQHYYADMRIEGFSTDYADYGQFSLTFGYRF